MKTVLFVCTGNTCRSPMAEGIFNRRAKEKGIGWRAVSCGISAGEGQPASENAVLALLELGVDIGSHRAKQVREALLKNADMVVCVTGRHADLLSDAFPGEKDKITIFKTEIPDPYGGDLECYRKTAGAISKAVLEMMRGIKDGV